MSLFRFFFRRWHVVLVTMFVCAICSLNLFGTVTGLYDFEHPRSQSPYILTIKPIIAVLNSLPAHSQFSDSPKKLHDAYFELFGLAMLKLFIDNFSLHVLLPTWITLVGGLLLDCLIRNRRLNVMKIASDTTHIIRVPEAYRQSKNKNSCGSVE